MCRRVGFVVVVGFSLLVTDFVLSRWSIRVSG